MQQVVFSAEVKETCVIEQAQSCGTHRKASQCTIAQPVHQEPSLEYSLTGAKGSGLVSQVPCLGDAIVVVGD